MELKEDGLVLIGVCCIKTMNNILLVSLFGILM
jgi:hypothetical protein